MNATPVPVVSEAVLETLAGEALACEQCFEIRTR